MALALPVTAARAQGSQSLNNPLDASVSNFPALITAILNIFLIVLTPFAVFFIIYAGFMYVTAHGNPAKIAAANKALMYGIIGGIIIVGAGAITAIVQNLVAEF